MRWMHSRMWRRSDSSRSLVSMVPSLPLACRGPDRIARRRRALALSVLVWAAAGCAGPPTRSVDDACRPAITLDRPGGYLSGTAAAVTISGTTDPRAKVVVEPPGDPRNDDVMPVPVVRRDRAAFAFDVAGPVAIRMDYAITADRPGCPYVTTVTASADFTAALVPGPHGWSLPLGATPDTQSGTYYRIPAEVSHDAVVSTLRAAPPGWTQCETDAAGSGVLGTWYAGDTSVTITYAPAETAGIDFATDPTGGLACRNRPGGLARVDDIRGMVGTDLPPGRWRSAPGISDCYWEIADAAGATIENHFGFSGTTVMLRSGQQFRSKDCGYWTRVG